MTLRWAFACVVACVAASVGAAACGGSSSETPFPQSVDEVLPEIAAAARARPPGSSSLDLPPSPSAGSASGRRPPRGSSLPQISVSANSTPQVSPGTPPPPSPF